HGLEYFFSPDPTTRHTQPGGSIRPPLRIKDTRHNNTLPAYIGLPANYRRKEEEAATGQLAGSSAQQQPKTEQELRKDFSVLMAQHFANFQPSAGPQIVAPINPFALAQQQANGLPAQGQAPVVAPNPQQPAQSQQQQQQQPAAPISQSEIFAQMLGGFLNGTIGLPAPATPALQLPVQPQNGQPGQLPPSAPPVLQQQQQQPAAPVAPAPSQVAPVPNQGTTPPAAQPSPVSGVPNTQPAANPSYAQFLEFAKQAGLAINFPQQPAAAPVSSTQTPANSAASPLAGIPASSNGVPIAPQNLSVVQATASAAPPPAQTPQQPQVQQQQQQQQAGAPAPVVPAGFNVLPNGLVIPASGANQGVPVVDPSKPPNLQNIDQDTVRKALGDLAPDNLAMVIGLTNMMQTQGLKTAGDVTDYVKRTKELESKLAVFEAEDKKRQAAEQQEQQKKAVAAHNESEMKVYNAMLKPWGTILEKILTPEQKKNIADIFAFAKNGGMLDRQHRDFFTEISATASKVSEDQAQKEEELKKKNQLSMASAYYSNMFSQQLMPQPSTAGFAPPSGGSPSPTVPQVADPSYVLGSQTPSAQSFNSTGQQQSGSPQPTAGDSSPQSTLAGQQQQQAVPEVYYGQNGGGTNPLETNTGRAYTVEEIKATASKAKRSQNPDPGQRAIDNYIAMVSDPLFVSCYSRGVNGGMSDFQKVVGDLKMENDGWALPNYEGGL